MLPHLPPQRKEHVVSNSCKMQWDHVTIYIYVCVHTVVDLISFYKVYPPVIKRANGKSPAHGVFTGKTGKPAINRGGPLPCLTGYHRGLVVCHQQPTNCHLRPKDAKALPVDFATPGYSRRWAPQLGMPWQRNFNLYRQNVAKCYIKKTCLVILCPSMC